MKILLPTDFSTAANNALAYAVAFAKSQDAKIVAYHCYYPKINPANVLASPGMDTYMEQANGKMESLIQPYLEAGSDISSVIEVGFTIEKIVADAEEYACDMIIMGNTGQGHDIAPLFGSVSSETALRAHCPVLLIPSDHEYVQPKVIALASNKHSLQEKFLSRVIQVAETLKARLDLVHIDQDGSSIELPEAVSNSRITSLSDENDSLIDGLNRYARENQTDWLVMVPREKSFWQKLFTPSNTKEMAGNSYRPLLVIHNRDTKTALS